MIYTNENYIPPVTYCEPNKVEVQKMNRQEAIEILTGRYLIPVEDGADEHAERVNNALDMAIDALNHQTVFEQIKWERDMALQTLEEHGIGLGQKSDWIPVTKSTLPDIGVDVNVTIKDFAETWTGFLAEEGWWLITKEGMLENYPLEYVTAWKPLPKPYKESDKE